MVPEPLYCCCPCRVHLCSSHFALSSGRLGRGPMRGPLLKAISPRRPASSSWFDEKGEEPETNRKHEHDKSKQQRNSSSLRHHRSPPHWPSTLNSFSWSPSPPSRTSAVTRAAPWRVPPSWPNGSSPASSSPAQPRSPKPPRLPLPNQWRRRSHLPGASRGFFLLANRTNPKPLTLAAASPGATASNSAPH